MQMARKIRGASLAEVEAWRMPDDEGKDWAVWYGPGGSEGDTASVAARTSPYQYRFGEVQNVVGLIDNPVKNFLVTSVTIDLDDAIQWALHIDGDEARQRLDQAPEQKKLRIAAAVASDLIPKFGGEERWAGTLSDGIATII